MWMGCEIEKRKFPEMFSQKYDGTRKDTMQRIEKMKQPKSLKEIEKMTEPKK